MARRKMVRRFDSPVGWEKEADDGKLMLYADYAALESKLNEWRALYASAEANLTSCREEQQWLQSQLDELRAENSELQAYYEEREALGDE